MRNFINIVEKASAPVTETPAFKAWFAGSKVVDADGQPLRVFHGGAPGIEAFDKSKIGQNFGVDKEGFFFTTNTTYSTAWYGGNDYRVYDDMYSAGAYAKNVNGTVYPCYLRMVNPLYLRDWADMHYLDYDEEVADYGHPQEILDRNKQSVMDVAREGGHDGVIAHHGKEWVFVVFEPNQIKSIFASKFDPESNNIAEAEAEMGTRFPKASARIAYSEDGDEADVFVRPAAGTVLKCIGNFDCRGIIYEDGTLVVWHQSDMYHQDVYEHPDTKRPGEFLTLMLFKPGAAHGTCVAVKGGEEEPVPFTDERWLPIIQGNRALRQIYGDGFAVSYENWF